MCKNLITLGFLLGLAATSLAATPITVTPKATATLTGSCQISAQNINFGELTPQNGETAIWKNLANGTISVLCTRGSSYTISNTLGVNNGGKIIFNLKGQTYGDLIQYGICQTNSFTQLPQCTLDWYNAKVQSGVGTGSNQDYITYGIVKTGYYRPDIYTDTITSTITF